MRRWIGDIWWATRKSRPSKWPKLYAQAYEQPNVAFRAAVRRSLAPLAGLTVGLSAALIVGCDAPLRFYEVAAQVIPVFFLALVFEKTGFAVSRKASRETPDALIWESVRRSLEFCAFASLVLAEAYAFYVLSGSDKTPDGAWLIALAVAGGVTLVAVSALVGRRPTVNLSIKVYPDLGDTGLRLVEIGMGNIFGDEDVEPVVNFMVPAAVELFSYRPNNRVGDPAPTLDAPTERLTLGNREVECKYTYPIVSLREGQSLMLYYFAKFPTLPVEMSLKLSNARLVGGGSVARVMYDEPANPDEMNMGQ